MSAIVFTIIGPDRPGLVDSLAHAVADNGGNWLESRMAHLGGKFAGIVRVDVPDAKIPSLVAALAELESDGVKSVLRRDSADSPDDYVPYALDLVGNDRPGIVHEISHSLATQGVNVEEFHSEFVSAPMSGEQLFRASARLRLPPSLDAETLRYQLEQLAHDMMVDVSLQKPSGESGM